MGKVRLLDITDVLKGVESLVTSIESESGRFAFSETQQERVDQSLTTQGLEALGQLVEKPRDGSTELEVDPSRMEVRVCLFPPLGEGIPLSLDTLEWQLEQAGIVHGILTPVLRRIIAEAAIDRKRFTDVVVARGTPSIDAYPERWEVEPHLLEHHNNLEIQKTSVDWKAVSPFIVVKKGELLARRVPEQAGSDGWDVYGNAIEFAKISPRLLQPGKNVESRPEGFFAQREGCFKIDERSFWVDEILVLDTGVSYATGHIDFAGDVQITGDIASGFHIHAQGGVHSTRVIDASEIQSGGDVTTPFGIIGHEGAVVKAEGKVQARFLENVFVLARGSLEIQSSVLNCILQTLDKLVMGDKGVIVGGKVTAMNGIDVFQVGTERGAKAELICGMDFTIVDKINWARDQSLSLVKQLKTLEAHKKAHPQQKEAIQAACGKIRKQVFALVEMARDLAPKIDRNDEVSIVVRGTVHVGTYIEICHVSYVVPRTLKAVRFVLDKNRGTIKALAL